MKKLGDIRNMNSGIYCGPCLYIDEKRKRCKKWNVKLSYSKISGAIKATFYEKCNECKNFKEEN